MKEKLTLTIEKETKKRAKRHAKAVGKSVSEMVEQFLNSISKTEEWSPPKGSEIAHLRGICTPKVEPFDYKAEKEKIMIERHGKA
ncbi:MAG: DUF6364 family protein [Balneolaceae bacterium]